MSCGDQHVQTTHADCLPVTHVKCGIPKDTQNCKRVRHGLYIPVGIGCLLVSQKILNLCTVETVRESCGVTM